MSVLYHLKGNLILNDLFYCFEGLWPNILPLDLKTSVYFFSPHPLFKTRNQDLQFWLQNTRYGHVGWTKCWVRVPKCALTTVHKGVFFASITLEVKNSIKKKCQVPIYEVLWQFVVKKVSSLYQIKNWNTKVVLNLMSMLVLT